MVRMVADLVNVGDFPGESVEAIKDAFAQLRHLTELRNRVVHYGGAILGPDLRWILAKKGAEPWVVDQKELWNAARDLVLIRDMLTFHLLSRFSRVDVDPDQATRKGPWLYKPPS